MLEIGWKSFGIVGRPIGNPGSLGRMENTEIWIRNRNWNPEPESEPEPELEK